MTREEYLGMKLNELFDGIDRGDFQSSDSIPDTYHFDVMEALFYYAEQLEGGKELYLQLFRMVNEKGWNAIRNKINSGETVNVTFLAISAAEWPTDELYHMFEMDDRFSVSVTNVPLVDRSLDDRAKTYKENRTFFELRNYRVLDTYDTANDKVYSWEELGEVPDIVIHVSYWYESMPRCYHITQFPLKRVNLQISYSFATGNSTSGNFIYSVSSNKQILNMYNKVFVNSRVDLERFRKHQLLQGENVIYSGFSKMDYFYREHSYTDEQIRTLWKIPEGKNPEEIKKVIIAPHHAFLGYCGIKFSTFGQNAHFLLYLAKKYQDKISFLYKPHPNLRFRAVEAKVFDTLEDYDAYVRKWEDLPNVNIVVEGDYLDSFLTSDAMIMDSISFIAEYMYVNKPVLFLTRKEQAFSELGEMCMQAFDKTEGSNYMEIENFIETVILNNIDNNKEKRSEIFKKTLDYYSDNQCLASEFIYRNIMHELDC